MKHFKHITLMAAFTAMFALGPTAGWSSRMLDVVSGEITAVPLSGSIEVDHHRFRVKAGSSADRELHGFSEGQKVDLVLDGPPGNKESEVLSISLHDAS